MTLPAELLALIVAFAPPEHRLAGENANPLRGGDSGVPAFATWRLPFSTSSQPLEVAEILHPLSARVTWAVWYAA